MPEVAPHLSVVPARDETYGMDAAATPLEEPDSTSFRRKRPRPTMAPEAFSGMAGGIVNILDPLTEGAREAMLVQLLTLVGNAIGRTPHWRAGPGNRHGVNMFTVIVGKSARGKKGSGLDAVLPLVEAADPEGKTRITSGLSSGEGIIKSIRDPISKRQPDGALKEVDPGVEDKRLMVIEEEFGSVLIAMERTGNKLSPLLRNLWDGKTLRKSPESEPMTATDPHGSIIGHITPTELQARLTSSDTYNGFANRFLWCWSESDKNLPEGGILENNNRAAMVGTISQAINHARTVHHPMRFTSDAQDLWGRNNKPTEGLYAQLTAEKSGMLGTLQDRGAPYVRRLACLYALLELRTEVGTEHLMSALAVWEYCCSSFALMFGSCTGNPMSDDILTYLEERRHEHPESPAVTRTMLRDFFSRNARQSEINAALDVLREGGHVTLSKRQALDPKTQRPTGRPAEMWSLTTASESTNLLPSGQQ